MKSPNFFIVGAPKSGTTSLSEYLRQHSEVCFSYPKEPAYFCTDFGDAYRTVKTEKEYLRCFRDADERHKAVGEGTTTYLYSREAARNIRAFNPDAKIVAMLRNPVDMAYSLHAQVLFSLSEDVEDFCEAWRLQEARAKGERIPPRCVEPRFLQYRAFCLLGEQMQRLYRHFPREQVLVLLFDEFARDTRGAYEQTLDFLGLSRDGRTDFPRINENKQARSPLIAKLALTPPAWLRRPADAAKRILNIQTFGVMSRLLNATCRPVRRPPLPETMRETLQEDFREDVELLGEVLGRDLSHWLQPESPRDAQAAAAHGERP